MNKEELVKLLEELGIIGNEAKVYLACLELGPTTITKIAYKAGIERATVYAILDRLKEKGLVTINVKESDRHIQVESPDKLLVLSKHKKRAIEEKEHHFREILPDLLASVNQRGKQPKVKFYEGEAQYIEIFDHIIDEAKGEMYYFGDVDRFVKMVSWEFERNWVKRRIRKKIFIKLLINKGKYYPEYKKRDARELRETRFYPAEMKFESSYLLWNNKIALWNPVVPLAIVIEDEIIVKMFKEMFLGLWEKI